MPFATVPKYVQMRFFDFMEIPLRTARLCADDRIIFDGEETPNCPRCGGSKETTHPIALMATIAYEVGKAEPR